MVGAITVATVTTPSTTSTVPVAPSDSAVSNEDGAESGEGEGVGVEAITTAAPVAPNDTAVSNETTTTQASNVAPVMNSASNITSTPNVILTDVTPTTESNFNFSLGTVFILKIKPSFFSFQMPIWYEHVR